MGLRCCIACVVQVKASEGMAYNVVSNVPRDEARLRALEESQANSTLHRVRPAVEAYMSATGVAIDEKGACTVIYTPWAPCGDSV